MSQVEKCCFVAAVKWHSGGFVAATKRLMWFVAVTKWLDARFVYLRTSSAGCPFSTVSPKIMTQRTYLTAHSIGRDTMGTGFHAGRGRPLQRRRPATGRAVNDGTFLGPTCTAGSAPAEEPFRCRAAAGSARSAGIGLANAGAGCVMKTSICIRPKRTTKNVSGQPRHCFPKGA